MGKLPGDLEFASSEHNQDCDGCGQVVPAGEVHLGGIESCCGGCYRHLCMDCIKAIAEDFLSRALGGPFNAK